MTQAGYIKSVAADAFKVQGRGGRGVQGANCATRTSCNRSCTRPPTRTFVVLEPWSRVPTPRSRDPDEKSAPPREPRRQPVEPSAERVNPGDRDDGRLPEGQVLGVRDGERHREEDGVQRVRQVAPRGLDRHQPARRRRVVRVVATSGDEDLMVVTYRGMAIRFQEPKSRSGRDSMGVRGIKLRATTKRSHSTSCVKTPTCSWSLTPDSVSASRSSASIVKVAGTGRARDQAHRGSGISGRAS